MYNGSCNPRENYHLKTNKELAAFIGCGLTKLREFAKELGLTPLIAIGVGLFLSHSGHPRDTRFSVLTHHRSVLDGCSSVLRSTRSDGFAVTVPLIAIGVGLFLSHSGHPRDTRFSVLTHHRSVLDDLALFCNLFQYST